VGLCVCKERPQGGPVRMQGEATGWACAYARKSHRVGLCVCKEKPQGGPVRMQGEATGWACAYARKSHRVGLCVCKERPQGGPVRMQGEATGWACAYARRGHRVGLCVCKGRPQGGPVRMQGEATGWACAYARGGHRVGLCVPDQGPRQALKKRLLGRLWQQAQNGDAWNFKHVVWLRTCALGRAYSPLPWVPCRHHFVLSQTCTCKHKNTQALHRLGCRGCSRFCGRVSGPFLWPCASKTPRQSRLVQTPLPSPSASRADQPHAT